MIVLRVGHSADEISTCLQEVVLVKRRVKPTRVRGNRTG